MDKVADLLIRIKNGYMASRKEVTVSYSKLSVAICNLLEKEGYIQGCEALGREIKVTLKYDNKQPALTDVKRVSKPGRRVYQGKKMLPRVLGGLGVAIISTPKGVMTDKQARKEGVGGEIMAYVW
ncbi:MAG: 30S ribosomal protein S8 [Patescibacteria group bacterium]|nr:30S ribosomal protein S8 [Patescibacteria group bacterium]